MPISFLYEEELNDWYKEWFLYQTDCELYTFWTNLKYSSSLYEIWKNLKKDGFAAIDNSDLKKSFYFAYYK